ncbi:uncharacterized protein [Nicotiana sylvestris]|uniref:uncharacterized protein n=1 Tax=Nicotiana sylvestris TaxID=4096 RepID=UPI00388C6A2F
MRRSRSANNLLPLDPEIERTFHRLRREVDARSRIERELDIVVQSQPIEMAGNEECAVIEIAMPSLANMTQAIVKPDITRHFDLKQYMVQLIQSTWLFVGLPHEDPQRHIQNFLEITDTYNYPNISKDNVRLTLFPFSLIGEAKEWLNKEPANSVCTWDDLARKFLIKFFPTNKTKILRSQILGFEQRASETLRQAWERYKKMLRDCPHPCLMDEVLDHTFVDGLDDASKINLYSACGGSCMARPYNEIQILLNNFTANDNNWQGEGDSRKAVKQKSAGLLELDEVSSMRADIAKLANQMTRMTMQQPHTMQHNRGPPNQHAQYGNSYNPNWRNHPNFSWGGNQQNQNQHRPQGSFNQLQRPPQQMEESTNDLLKKLLIDNQQLRIDFRNLERQMGQLSTNQKTRPAGALPSVIEKNPQVNAVTLRNGRELEEVPKKNKDKPIPEGELIPKVIHEPKNVAEIPDPYAKYIKDIVAHKRRLTEFETVTLTEECTSRVQNKLPQKLKDLGSFTIPVHIGNIDQLADKSIAHLEWVIEDVLLQIGKFIFPADFIILDYEADELVPIILGRPLLATGDAIIKVREGKMILRVDDEEAVFNVYKAIQLPRHYEELSMISVVEADE